LLFGFALCRDLLNDGVVMRINGDGNALPYIEIGLAAARTHRTTCAHAISKYGIGARGALTRHRADLHR
jgi:hypothetical protein